MDNDTAKQVIFTTGPIETAFDVYRDFMSYESGVYYPTTDEKLGGHAVKIVGWGHDDVSNLDYWLVANSWGTSWGIDGFFKIKPGVCNFARTLIVGDYIPGMTTGETNATYTQFVHP